MTMRLASYKGTRPGLPGLFNALVRWWCDGPYSHNELIFSDGVCASSANLDGGLRFKVFEPDPAKWDVIDIEGDEAKAREWFANHDMDGYDLLGLFGFVWRRGVQDKDKWFCSEAIAEALGIEDSWRFDPCQLPIVLQQRSIK